MKSGKKTVKRSAILLKTWPNGVLFLRARTERAKKYIEARGRKFGVLTTDLCDPNLFRLYVFEEMVSYGRVVCHFRKKGREMAVKKTVSTKKPKKSGS